MSVAEHLATHDSYHKPCGTPKNTNKSTKRILSMLGRKKSDTSDDVAVAEFELDPRVRELVKGDSIAKSYGDMTLGAFFSSPYMILCSAASGIGGLLFGIDQGLISIILGMSQFLEQFPETDAKKTSNAAFNQGVMTALLELGAAFGALQSGYAADKISRRYALLLGLAWFTVGSILQTTAFHFAQLVVGRFIGGIGIGTLAVVSPLFVGEIAPPHLRGALLVFFEWMIVVGAVVAFYMTYGTQYIKSDWSFRLPFLIQIFPGLLAGIIVLIMPFSPRWLVLKGRDQEALITISKLRGLPTTDARIQAEWIGIQAEIQSNEEAQKIRHPSLRDKNSGFKKELLGWMDLFRPGVLQRTMVGVGLTFFQQFTGINAVVYYAPSLYAALGYPRTTQLTYSGITNVLQLVGVTPAFYLMDKLGRRPLILGGTIACFVCHMIIGTIIAKYYTDWPSHLTAAKGATAFLMLYMFSFGLSWGPIPWAMPTEVCASSYRAKGVGLATISSWIWNFVVGLITPTLVAHSHAYGAFYFFAGWLVLAFIFAYFVVPETRGVSLEEMDEKFHNTAGQEDERRRQDILDRLIEAGSRRGRSIGEVKEGPGSKHLENA